MNLKDRFINLKENEALAKYTSFKIGGKAKFFLNVLSEEDLKEALGICAEKNIYYFILGGGSNVLISDRGFNGLVLKMSLNSINWFDNLAEAGAGVVLAAFSMLAINRGLGGMEVATTIPGTVGGAIRGNAGAYGWETKDSLLSVKAFDCELGDFKVLEREECEFKYRDSVFKHSPLIAISGTFRFNAQDKDELFRKAKFYQDKKADSQPMEFPNSGCIFKNILIEDTDLKLLEKEDIDISQFRESGKIPAGFLIEKLGLKGKKIGSAQISEKHGNFIINLGGATADEVIQTISFIKQQARDRLGIQLKEEIQYLGF